VPDVQAARDSFHKTSIGQLSKDPSLEDFFAQLMEKVDEFQEKAEESLGLSLSEVQGLFAGEVTVAVVRPVGQSPGGVVFVDIGDQERVFRKLIAKFE